VVPKIQIYTAKLRKERCKSKKKGVFFGNVV
jgi:hypothetical protein